MSPPIDRSNGDSMSVGFAYNEPGASNDWVVTYDEALIVTHGAHSVTSEHGEATTARAGEIFLRKGTRVVCSVGVAGAKVVYSPTHTGSRRRTTRHAPACSTPLSRSRARCRSSIPGRSRRTPGP